MLERYSTERIAPSQRIRRWCEFGSHTLSSIAVHPQDPKAFSARLLRVMVGDIGITQTQTTPALAVARGGECGHWAGARDGSVLITLQKAGKSRLRQGGRDVALCPGDVVIRDLRRPWEMEACSDTTLFSVKASASSLTECLGDLDAHVAVPLRAGDRRTDLLSSSIEHLCKLAFEHPAPLDPGAVRGLVYGAARIAYAGDSLAADLPAGQDRFERGIFQFVDERLYDPAVTVAGLAKALGMSVRSFQRIFYQCGTSPRAYIIARRLDLAAERLRDLPPGFSVKVTDVALTCGFNDPSYFGRAFQQRFGMTPSDFLRRNRSVG